MKCALIREAANELDRRYSADAVAQGVTQQSEVKWRSTEDELAGISREIDHERIHFSGLAILVALLAIASLGYDSRQPRRAQGYRSGGSASSESRREGEAFLAPPCINGTTDCPPWEKDWDAPKASWR